MDFARKQLEKYGWTHGKGLGKNENGISEALKPKLKRSVAGIGHDPASDFTEHWWSQLYNKAAKNVEVEEKNGKTKKIKTKDGQFTITNSAYQLSKKCSPNENQEEYADFFVKTAVLTNGGSKVEKVKDSESEEEDKRDVFKLTDEELFAACEGRTAHKGARHGLKASGKLARIERQEQMLLAEPKYSGYSQKKCKDKKTNPEMDLEVVEHMNLDEGDFVQIKKKKNMRKRCLSSASMDTTIECTEKAKTVSEVKFKKAKPKNKLAESGDGSLPTENDIEMSSTCDDIVGKRKNSKRKLGNQETPVIDVKYKKIAIDTTEKDLLRKVKKNKSRVI